MFFLAQSDIVPTNLTVAFISVTVSMVALVGWLIRHIFVTTIPAIVAEQKAQRESNEDNLAIVINNSKAESSSERKLCADQSAVLNATLVALTAATDKERELIVRDVNTHTTEQASLYRHELRDVIQEAVLGKELYLAKKTATERMHKGEETR